MKYSKPHEPEKTKHVFKGKTFVSGFIVFCNAGGPIDPKNL